MELKMVNYPFKQSIGSQKPILFGCFNNSSWSFMFESSDDGEIMTITRSNTSERFAIICSFTITFRSRDPQEVWFLKYTVDGEANVVLPFSYNSWYPQNISGYITVLELPTSTSNETQVSVDTIDSFTEYIPPLVENSEPIPQLLNDFHRLLNNPDSYPDITLKCGAEEILVHKAILSGRSPVFAAMFKNEMQESNCGFVEMVDIEPNVLQATMKYVYSGKTEDLDEEIAEDVLFAANKYQLEALKKVCIDKMKNSITADNVFRFLVLGDLHDESLKVKAKEFLCKCGQFSNLENAEGWKSLQSENPGLAMEVLLFAFNYGQKLLTKSTVSK